MRFIIVTGFSGAGKTTALKILENIGFFCVDNLPSILLTKFADLCFQENNEFTKVAVGIDARGRSFFNALESALEYMEKNKQEVKVEKQQVRKGKGINDDQVKLMKDNNVPDWFVWTCKKIKYLFPKAHATAYVIMALRIGWFKVHRPIYYYAVYFSVRAKEYDAEIFALGKNAIRNKIQEIEKKIQNHDVTNKEENLFFIFIFIIYFYILYGSSEKIRIFLIEFLY